MAPDPTPANSDENETYDLSTRNGRTAKAKANRRIRAANRVVNKAKEQARRSANSRKAKRVRCTAITKRGTRCLAMAVAPKEAPTLCKIHSATQAELEILMAQARAIRQQHKLKPHELMRQVIESNPVAFMQPYLDALGIRIIFLPDENDPRLLHPTAVVDPTSSGAMLYGVSKDGDVVVSKHKDIEAQQRAAERLFDRVYGKPKQTNIIAGANLNEDPQIVPFDAKRQAEIAAILEASKSPSHNLPTNSNN